MLLLWDQYLTDRSPILTNNRWNEYRRHDNSYKLNSTLWSRRAKNSYNATNEGVTGGKPLTLSCKHANANRRPHLDE